MSQYTARNIKDIRFHGDGGPCLKMFGQNAKTLTDEYKHLSHLCITVKSVMRDHPMGTQKVVLYDRSLIGGINVD